jgi:hypothetical protein
VLLTTVYIHLCGLSIGNFAKAHFFKVDACLLIAGQQQHRIDGMVSRAH